MSDAIPFNREMEFVYGEAERLSPLVRRVMAPNPSPFTFRGTATFIVGDEHVAVIDPGPLDDGHHAALMAALEGRTVDHILVTHTHNDHSPLAARLKAETGARTYAFGPHGAGRISRAASDTSVALDAGGDREFVPDVELDHGDVVEGPGWTFDAVFTPGHTSNHMSFALREEGTLFVGDHVMGWSTSVIAPPDGSMADYMESLDKLLAREDRIYRPTHGPHVDNPLPFVEKFRRHRQRREEAILHRLREGDRTIAEMVPRIYLGIDPKLHGAAALSTFAHIEHLLERGVIVSDGPATIDGHYRPAGD